MRAVVQRVSEASVSIDGATVGKIGEGLLVLLGAGAGDSERDLEYVASKVLGLRIFPDEDGKMNRSLVDIRGEALIVSQFTLYGDTRKGRRPSFVRAMDPCEASPMVDRFVERLAREVKVATGRFGADMDVRLCNRGPVTLLIDSTKTF